jgi:polysaccharide export outer membrane protein
MPYRKLESVMRILIYLLLFVSLSLAQDKPSSFASRDQRYRLQPNDVVDVQFRYTPEFNSTATIQPDGYITSAIAGQIHVGGLTLTEAADAITKQANVRLKDPEVTVFLKDFVKPHFVVAGEVAHPGTFELRGDIGIIQAIATSGGFKDSARRTQVVLVRKFNSEMAEVKVFDVRKLMTPKNIREDITLKPGDMLVVPRNNLSKLEPYMHISSLGAYGLAMGVP